MNISIKFILRKDKARKNGQFPVHLRLIQDRQYYHLSTKHYLDASSWDNSRERVKATYARFKAINEDLADLFNRVIRMSNDGLHPVEILANLKKIPEAPTQNNSPYVLESIQTLISQLRMANRISYARAFSDLHAALVRFWKKDQPATIITYTMLADWESFLVAGGCSLNTVFIYMRHLKVIVNRFRKSKLMPKEWYPFEDFSFARYTKIKPAKRAISQEAIQQLIEFDPPTSAQRQAKDFFLFSYFCWGINFRDMALLTPSNLNNNRLYYIRSKTKKPLSMNLLPPVIALLNKYENTTGYLLPILDCSVDVTVDAIEDKIRSSRQNINRCLKKLGKAIGLSLEMTTYVARHSFATGMKKRGVRNGIISEMMGHPTEQVTQIYLKSFDDDELDAAAELLL